MPFTDDDLKRLKDDVVKGGWSPKMPALIARLEAAEKILNCSNEGCVIDKNHWIEWREACGK